MMETFLSDDGMRLVVILTSIVMLCSGTAIIMLKVVRAVQDLVSELEHIRVTQLITLAALLEHTRDESPSNAQIYLTLLPEHLRDKVTEFWRLQPKVKER
jgi:hypothetical protein